MPSSKYRYVGSHAQDFDTGGKVLMVGPGDEVSLDIAGDDKQYQYLVDNGQLLDMSGVKASAPPAAGGGENK